MTAERPWDDRQRRRRDVRRRALANLIVALLAEADRSDGRLTVRPFTADALLLGFRDVRTLVGRTTLAVEPRDFEVLLACPPEWPFDRAAALRPLVLDPDDFRHPNSNGRDLCLDMAGVAPEILPRLLYDNLRLERLRLDDCVDRSAADFVRTHPSLFPCDRRALMPATEQEKAS